MFSEKKSVRILASVLAEKGIHNIVFSPGSRNAPLVIEFTGNKSFNTISIPDERCAAFYAMGIAQWNKAPSVICCTSGSAALNYAPAIAEAYYQGIPMIVLTADRPNEWIDHGEGQSIRQRDVFRNYIKESFEIPQSENEENDWFCNRIINEAINISLEQKPGPVHINLPFAEPLYGKVQNEISSQRLISRHLPVYELSESDLSDLKKVWGNSDSKLVICGLGNKNDRLNQSLNRIAEDTSVAILSETTSNQFGNKIYPNIDRIIAGIDSTNIDQYQPEILVTIGGPIVSKKIKALFRNHQPKEHWHIDISPVHQDMFQCLTRSIVADPVFVFNAMDVKTEVKEDSFAMRWGQKHWQTKVNHEKTIQNLSFSDLSVYRDVLDYIPDDSVIHLANSTAVRYAQLFEPLHSAVYFCNRGTSGIDGSTSTAIGSASVNNKINILLSGDTAFLYDSNAFWNTDIQRLKIVVVNNNGGGIFRIIDGPDQTDSLVEYFEVPHEKSVMPIAEMYGLPYYSAKNQQELEAVLPEFFKFDNQTTGILEVFTNPEDNPQQLKDYFQHLKH